MSKEIILFLGYTNGDFADEQILSAKPTGVMAALESLNPQRAEQIKRLGLKFGISLVALPGKDVCPASKEARDFLLSKIAWALEFKPDVIWLDHLRFDGHWEAIVEAEIGIHPSCQYCKDKQRTEVISELARLTRQNIPQSIKVGYFAVPFKEEDYGGVISLLGQDHEELGKIFNYISPMLYQRMIGKPATYIKEYVEYLADMNVKAQVLPIVQVKDMPDNLPDMLGIHEIKKEITFSLTEPAIGVAIFCWDHVIEKRKLEGVSKILRKIK